MGPSTSPDKKPLPIGKGARTPTTQYAMEKFLAYYERRFGHSPEKLYGLMAWTNKLNFQREYYKLEKKGMAPDKAAELAITRISFGKHRIAVGYDKFEVKIGAAVTVDLGIDPDTGKNLGKQEVPARIEAWATRSKK